MGGLLAQVGESCRRKSCEKLSFPTTGELCAYGLLTIYWRFSLSTGQSLLATMHLSKFAHLDFCRWMILALFKQGQLLLQLSKGPRSLPELSTTLLHTCKDSDDQTLIE